MRARDSSSHFQAATVMDALKEGGSGEGQAGSALNRCCCGRPGSIDGAGQPSVVGCPASTCGPSTLPPPYTFRHAAYILLVTHTFLAKGHIERRVERIESDWRVECTDTAPRPDSPATISQRSHPRNSTPSGIPTHNL